MLQKRAYRDESARRKFNKRYSSSFAARHAKGAPPPAGPQPVEVVVQEGGSLIAPPPIGILGDAGNIPNAK